MSFYVAVSTETVDLGAFSPAQIVQPLVYLKLPDLQVGIWQQSAI